MISVCPLCIDLWWRHCGHQPHSTTSTNLCTALLISPCSSLQDLFNHINHYRKPFQWLMWWFGRRSSLSCPTLHRHLVSFRSSFRTATLACWSPSEFAPLTPTTAFSPIIFIFPVILQSVLNPPLSLLFQVNGSVSRRGLTVGLSCTVSSLLLRKCCRGKACRAWRATCRGNLPLRAASPERHRHATAALLRY